jgi:hypothetical protein
MIGKNVSRPKSGEIQRRADRVLCFAKILIA